jgi:hypothetical protein
VVSVGRGGQDKGENKIVKKGGIKRPGERGRGRASARPLKKYDKGEKRKKSKKGGGETWVRLA